MDCKTAFYILLIIGLIAGYKFLDRHWPSIWTGGIWTIRIFCFLGLIGLLLLGGPTGEELIPGAIWAIAEVFNWAAHRG